MRFSNSTRWSLVMIALILVSQLFPVQVSLAHTRKAAKRNLRPPVELTAAQDHRRTMNLLHISSLRPAPISDPTASNHANYDESKANAYPNLPDPLVLPDGQKVASAEIWWNERRPQIVEAFDREIYGRMPKHTPKVRWEVIRTKNETVGGISAVTRDLIGHVDNSSYPLITVNIRASLTLPAKVTRRVPVMMAFEFDPVLMRRLLATLAARGEKPPPLPPGPSWQQQVLARGWGYALIIPTSYQDDNGAALTKGIIGLCNQGHPRKLDDWGTLRAWAWGAGRLLDYLQTVPEVDSKHVGIEGLSRYGKAALVTMAYDPRFAIGLIGSSGAGGAKLFRRNFGESVEDLASVSEYQWFDGNFLKYAGPLNPGDLPIDAHELIALVAPRPLFISEGSPTVEGGWLDDKGQFLAEVYAGPVYRLLGKHGLGANKMPPIGAALVSGDLAFRQHQYGHTDFPNWPAFLNFAARYM